MRTEQEINKRIACYKNQLKEVAILSDEYFELFALLKEYEWLLENENRTRD